MKEYNVHERELNATAEQAGALLDSLSSPKDALWPGGSWPRIKLDRPLGVGAAGGHGPIRYHVEDYSPGKSIRFRFTSPKGFDGFHCFEISGVDGKTALLRHTIKMNTRGMAVLLWPFFIRPLHDALLEDLLANAEVSLGYEPRMKAWPLRVRILRWIMSGGKSRNQSV